ncbi:hypothetical protein D9611_013432 [Ephemerocybe angulata]|uniref:CHAT domain-containing protein n=1 Tax=Ephemerocybe angulata TaxID=980116 RepID=A0A8H5BUK8_9AGAR|nr:hypothetical protein D9611_013432 [Tulosesus angulatus]
MEQTNQDAANQFHARGIDRMISYEQTGNLSDMTDGISMLQQAVSLTPEGDANLPGRLCNLGNALLIRHRETGELTDIVDAIGMQRKAVELIPEGSANVPGLLNNLGTSLTRRFERTGDLSDIDDAIAVHRQAMELTPQNDASLPGRISNLGSSYTRRFERTGNISDITESIALQQKVVDLTPQGNPNLTGFLSNLGLSLMCRFEHTSELADIERAISAQKKAVKITPQEHPELPGLLNNLGASLIRRFHLTHERPVVTYAIEVQRKALSLTPEGHADRPGYLNNLGLSYHYRFTSSGDRADLEETLSSFKAAAFCAVGPPQVKFDAAQRWAGTLIQHRPDSMEEIFLSCDTALGLVALMAGLEQTVRGRHAQIEKTAGLAMEAAAAACARDRPDKALEWLEEGRCLVWNQLTHLRSPLDNLRIQNDALAQDIADVAKQLEHAGSSRSQSHAGMSLSEKVSVEDEARSHLDLAQRWSNLLEAARKIPGFESFLKPSPCSALMEHLPESGPIIVINVNNLEKRRCDALALLAGLDEPLHIPLPNFSIEKAGEYRTILGSQLHARRLRVREVEETRGIRSAPVGKGGDVHRVLRGLWEDVVKPILHALGFSGIDQTSGELPPRLWWCPTGPLSFLPLHAAGIYRGPNADSVSNYVVSSYTPTVTALTERVKNPRSVDPKASGLLLTSQPHVPDTSPIPGTTKEVRSIFKQAEESGMRALKLEGEELSIAECLDHMQHFSSIHLACHGSQNAAEPLQSRFLFHQGSLELGAILQSNLQNGDLAFLSACQTSTGEEKLSDEAVHLAAGMLAAGYQRVVGTMWSIGDQAGQDVATSFYEYLFTQRKEGRSNGGFDGTHSAFALHHAIQELRRKLDDSEDSLLSWIPFVHFGY